MSQQDSQLFLTALRVLSKSIHGEPIPAQAVAEIRCQARSDEIHLPLDELCCRVVRRFGGDPIPLPESPDGFSAEFS